MITPAYRDEQATLYAGDCLDILPALPACSVDAIITDPPYITPSSTGRQGGSWTDINNASRWYIQWLTECGRILRPTGVMWITFNWRALPLLMLAVGKAGLDVGDCAIWDKLWIGPGGSRGLRSRYEMCLLVPMPKWRNPDRSAANVWPIQGIVTSKPTGHPAEKPLPLMRHIVSLSQLPAGGGTVLDPFAGSGTTLLAAAEAGHQVIGIEDDERWARLCEQRLASRQLGLQQTGMDLSAAPSPLVVDETEPVDAA